jgi:hypothetical protein
MPIDRKAMNMPCQPWLTSEVWSYITAPRLLAFEFLNMLRAGRSSSRSRSLHTSISSFSRIRRRPPKFGSGSNASLANPPHAVSTHSTRTSPANLVRNTERPYARQQHPHACDSIKAWAQAQRLDAAVWTALPSNFEEVAQRPFSVEAAILHLKALTEPAKSRALEHLQKAPPEVVTPVRTAAIQAGLIAL